MVTHHFGSKIFMNEKASGGLAFSFRFCGGGGGANGQCFYFGHGIIFKLLCWGSGSKFQKYWSWANQMAPFVREREREGKEKRNKNCERTP